MLSLKISSAASFHLIALSIGFCKPDDGLLLNCDYIFTEIGQWSDNKGWNWPTLKLKIFGRKSELHIQ